MGKGSSVSGWRPWIVPEANQTGAKNRNQVSPCTVETLTAETKMRGVGAQLVDKQQRRRRGEEHETRGGRLQKKLHFFFLLF